MKKFVVVAEVAVALVAVSPPLKLRRVVVALAVKRYPKFA